MATVTVTHATQTGAPADPLALVDGPAWDADHAVAGLENVDNTSDLAKPISNATQIALNAKADWVANIAALKSVNVNDSSKIFVGGYYSIGDGGGGWFYGNTGSSATADNGLIFAPNTGSGRWLRIIDGEEINVKWFGLKGDNTTESHTLLNAARDAAIAGKGILYFPGPTARYLLDTTALVIPDGTHGLTIRGDARSGQTPGSSGTGTTIVTTGATVIDMTGVALGGTGSISEITIKNVNLFSSGASGKALKAWNVDGLTLDNVLLDASHGVGLDMCGTAHFRVTAGTQIYSAGGSPIRFAQDAVGAQPNGPGEINGVHCSITNGAYSVVSITGDHFGVVFNACDLNMPGGTAAAVVDINGPAVTIGPDPVGSITFLQCHMESTYNGTNTGKSFRIGNVNKFGSVIIDGGAYFGHGNGTNYQQDMVQVVAAKYVEVRGVIATKLAATNGYSRSMIRLETTFPTAGDTYAFEGLTYQGSGNMFSDASGLLVGAGDKRNTSINGLGITPTSGANLTINSGVTVTGPAASGTVMTLGNNETVSGIKSFNDGKLVLNGLTSGSSTVKAPATGGGTATLFAGSDTVVGKATTDTLTNKTFDTAGTGNSFSINGVAATANTGTGSVVRATSPTLVTPALGAATATSINGLVLDTNAFTSYSPAVTSGSGTITTSSATGAYKILNGKACAFWAKPVITTNGTGASRVEVTLPFTAANSVAFSGANGTTGVVLSASVITSISATKVLIFNSTGAYPGADGWVGLVSGVFETT